MNECFECGSTENIHYHHVVPRSLGGIKTIPLCEKCHGKIHGLNFQNHGDLIKIGMRKAKARGVKIGRQLGQKPHKNQIEKYPDIVKLLLEGVSIRKVAKETNKGASTVQRVKKILKNDKQ